MSNNNSNVIYVNCLSKRSNYKRMNDSTRVIRNKIAVIERDLDHLRKADEGKIVLDNPNDEIQEIIDKAHEIFETLSTIVVAANDEKWRN